MQVSDDFWNVSVGMFINNLHALKYVDYKHCGDIGILYIRKIHKDE